MSNLPDLQNSADTRGIPINRVGVKNVKFPIKVQKRETAVSGSGSKLSLHPVQDAQATVALYVSLPADYKGANMSRFLEVLIGHQDTYMSPETVEEMATTLREKMKSVDAWIRMEFDYFISKPSPVTKLDLPQSYHIAFSHSIGEKKDTPLLEVNVVGASVCPCSKEMSDMGNTFPLPEELQVISHRCDPIVRFRSARPSVGESNQRDQEPTSFSRMYGMGAHNQRCNVRMEVVPEKDMFVWIEDLVEIGERQVSVPVYPILKRPDEQFVTIAGYKNPKFVEDIARDVAVELKQRGDLVAWNVVVTSDESIHPHDCICYVHSENWGEYR